MGPDAAALADRGVERIAVLEARWSRFRPDSELNALNASGGAPTVVSVDTALLVRRMVEAWEATAGRYDPTLLDSLEAAGYSRSWDPLHKPSRVPLDGVSGPGRGCEGILVDVDTCLVSLPVGVRIDPGGIGKGLAADIVTAELLALGADGALVNLGGDVRVRGDDGEGTGWCIAVEDPHDPASDLATVTVSDGAVCTSSRLVRRWSTTDGVAHHLLDPGTGKPIDGAIDCVTVVAGDAWWAEALTKAAFVAGADSGPHVIAASGACGLIVFSDGSVAEAGDFMSFAAQEMTV